MENLSSFLHNFLLVMGTGEEGGQEELCLLFSVHVTEECFSHIVETANWWQKYLTLHLKRQITEEGSCMQEACRVVK